MAQSIKEIYNHIQQLSNNYCKNHLGTFINSSLLKSINHNIAYIIRQNYPMLNPIINVELDNYHLNINIEIQCNSFPLMSFNNYYSHDFIEDNSYQTTGRNFYFPYIILKCQKCNIKITESGSPIDADMSCNDWIIKNLIE